jgi:hypothetical protein
MTAMGVPREDDLSARAYALNSAPRRLHDTRRFMPKHDRKRASQLTLDDFEIGMAKTRSHDADQYIGLFKLSKPDLRDPQWLAIARKNGSFEWAVEHAGGHRV